MLNAILNNPYRILGVYANSPKKEQIANKGKMQAFLRVGRTMDFPLDLKGILPEVARTQETIDLADSELALPADQVKHAQFWFVNVTPIDGIAFNHLLQGNLEAAICLWQKQTNASSLQNLFVAYLIKDDYIDAINLCAAPLYSDYATDFVKTIDENAAVKPTQLMEAVADTLTAEKVNSAELISDIKDKDWASLLENKAIAPIVEELERNIEEAKKKRKEDSNTGLSAGNLLMKQATDLLDKLTQFFPTDDNRYSRIADKACLEILQCGIDYYNDSDDEEAALKVYPLFEFARFYAIGNQAIQRCNENFIVIKRAADNLPPKEVREEVKKIESIIEKYRQRPPTCDNAISMLTEASTLLIAIKEKIGKSHKAYLDISTELATLAQNFVIDDVNEAMKEEEKDLSDAISNIIFPSDEQKKFRKKAYKLKEVYPKAWRATLLMGMLDLKENYRKDRYEPNKRTLYKFINDCDGFDQPNEPYILKGCAYNIHVENIFQTEDEFYFSCKDRYDYNMYLRKYPMGKHRLQARLKVEQLLYESCRNWKDFENYLKMYPMGNFVKQARTKLEKLLFEACKNISDYKNYLRRYPNGKFTRQADRQIKKLNSFWYKLRALFSSKTEDSNKADDTTHYILIFLQIPLFALIITCVYNSGKKAQAYPEASPYASDTTLVDSTTVKPNPEYSEDNVDTTFVDPFDERNENYNYYNEEADSVAIAN